MTYLNGPQIVRDGLILHIDAANTKSYPGTGTSWTDLSGGENNGTLTNGPVYSSNNKGFFTFDGADDFANFGTSFSNTLVNITVSSWYYPVLHTTPSFFLAKYTGGVNGWLLAHVSSTNRFSVDGRESTAAYFQNLTTNAIYPVNRWYNVVFTKSGTNWRLYINSVLEANNNNGNGTTSFNNGATFSVGRIDSIDTGKGNIAQVSVYNRALSQSEIAQNYNSIKGRFGL
jgi:hypothetical protein